MDSGDITLILQRIEEGDPHAGEQLLPLVYEELRRLAAAKMARETPGQTLQPTALVHEAWLRLGGDAQPLWANRAHFSAAAAESMRRILIDQARRKQAVRHGGGGGARGLASKERFPCLRTRFCKSSSASKAPPEPRRIKPMAEEEAAVLLFGKRPFPCRCRPNRCSWPAEAAEGKVAMTAR